MFINHFNVLQGVGVHDTWMLAFPAPLDSRENSEGKKKTGSPRKQGAGRKKQISEDQPLIIRGSIM
jgi:hypothetical protein